MKLVTTKFMFGAIFLFPAIVFSSAEQPTFSSSSSYAPSNATTSKACISSDTCETGLIKKLK